MLIAREVGIADVAAAGDGHRIVGDEQFVVHAVIDARDVRGGGEKTGPGCETPSREWIEDAHFDVGMLAQVQKASILTGGVQIIHQHAHAHAAFRREAHMVQQGAGRIILMNDVVLDVEGTLGVIGQGDQTGQCLFARGQQANAREILGAILGGDDFAQFRGFGVREGDAARLLHVPRQTGTSRKHQRQRHEHWP